MDYTCTVCGGTMRPHVARARVSANIYRIYRYAQCLICGDVVPEYPERAQQGSGFLPGELLETGIKRTRVKSSLPRPL